MKKSHKPSKLNLEKLKISKLKKPDHIKGGFIGNACVGGMDASSNNTDTHTHQFLY